MTKHFCDKCGKEVDRRFFLKIVDARENKAFFKLKSGQTTSTPLICWDCAVSIAEHCEMKIEEQ